MPYLINHIFAQKILFCYNWKIMGIKDFIVEKLIRSKMKNLPKAQQDMFIKLIDENPELFKKIGGEIKALTKSGVSEMTASMQVMRKYQAEIQKAIAQ